MPFTRIIWYEVVLFLGALAAIIAYRLLTGGINTNYLLYGTQRDGSKYFSPERLQLLLFTLGTAMFYLSDVLQNRNTGQLPDVPAQTLVLLGGSHAIYLGGKAYTMLFKKIAKESNDADTHADG
ncbi:MAG TPA: hypothetical protein VNO50_13610 [Pyrinomonadaceae bacterium]|nr:hypothetical protein [Pyrinomonadaceae bacterium]